MTNLVFGLSGFEVPTLVALACATVLAFLLGRVTSVGKSNEAS